MTVEMLSVTLMKRARALFWTDRGSVECGWEMARRLEAWGGKRIFEGETGIQDY